MKTKGVEALKVVFDSIVSSLLFSFLKYFKYCKSLVWFSGC